MGPKPAHTPKIVVKAGSLEITFPPECIKALAACGINPNSFGTYDGRLKEEQRARAFFQNQKPPVDPTSQAALEMDREKFLIANSQSGHMCQNAFFQGQRNSPCTNVPPADSDPATDGGSFGYQMGKAPCTDHYGGSTEPGTTHKKITVEEAARAAALRKPPNDPNAPIGEEDLEKYAHDTAKTAAEGNPGAKEGTVRAQKLGEAQAAEAKANQDPAKGGKADKAKTVDKAAECMLAAWKAAINQMREDCIAKYSTEARINREKPGQDNSAEIDDKKKKNKDKVTNPEFQQRVKDRDPSLKKAADKNACLEYQANWLQDYKNSHNGELPPLSGRVPGTSDDEGGSSNDEGAGNKY